MLRPPYFEELSEKMAQIFYRYEDFMLNLASPIPAGNPHRQQILSQSYPMQKKGKTLGTLEERAFRIHQGQPRQVDKNGQERDLPFPKQLIKQSLQIGSIDWKLKDHPYRILMQFEQRTPIYAYFKSTKELDEVYSFLLSKTQTQIKYTLDNAYRKYYKEKLTNYFASKISTIKLSKNFGNLEKKRGAILHKVKTEFSNEVSISQLLRQWHKKAVMTAKDPQKMPDSQSSNILNVKNVVSELCFNLEKIKSAPDVLIKNGELKLWVGQMTHNKIVKFNIDQITNQFVESLNEEGKPTKLKIATLINLGNAEIKLRNETPPLNLWTALQFQVETKNEEGQNKSWRSDRFYVIDLLKSLTKGPKKVINLWSGKNLQQLWITGKSAKCQVLKISLPPEHEYFPSSYTYKLTPNMYPILQQLIPKSILSKYIKSISPQTIHLQHTIAYQQYLQNQSTQSLCYSSFYKLYDLLQIDAIVNKFFSAQPYTQYSHVQNKGTFVYEFLARKSAKFAYYDAEKFIWKNQCTKLRRFLSTIKAFDEFPRINYTEPFFYLCLQCMRVAEKQSLIKWRSPSFSSSLMGRQSLAFFMVLGIVKTCSHLFLVQPNKSTLANNSLLFHYVLKKHNRKLYNKFLNIQLNIETLFGIESSSLFGSLFDTTDLHGYGGNDEIFLFILINCISERREQAKTNEDNKNSKQNLRNSHYVPLVAAFLAILEIFDMVTSSKQPRLNRANIDEIAGDSSAYGAANSYVKYLHIFACTQLQNYLPELILFYNKHCGVCLTQLNNQEYVSLQGNLDKFHEQNSLMQMQSTNQLGSMKLSELMEQLYSEFSCYKPKNEEDIRKITIIIDSINLGEYLLTNSHTTNSSPTVYRAASLLIQVMQSSTKLYEHQYIIPHKQAASQPQILAYDNIKHQIQIKLNKLSPLSLLLTYVHTNNVSSYCTVIDPRGIPSNYYIQEIKELTPVAVLNGSVIQRVGDLCCNNRYVCMQIYIKDSCDVEYLENSVPTSYINGLLLRGRVADNGAEDYRKDVIFCNHYFRSFRLMENNFNLLYAKLGWYGNHYLIPTDRVTAMYLVHHVTTQGTVTSHHPKTMSDLLASNIAEFQLKSMPELHKQRINQILFYSRCIYGRGLVPSIAYTGNTGTQVMMESLRNNRIVVKETKEIRNQINQCQYNSCGNLVGYLFNNFNTVSNGYSAHSNTNNFVDFYLRCTQQLPLIRYLSFHPLEFYLLEEIVFNLRLAPSQSESSQRNYTSTSVKNKIMANLPIGKKTEDFLQETSKTYQIILSNHSISPKANDPIHSKVPLKFITNPSYFNQELYLNYEAGNTYNTRDLYMELLESTSLPSTFYFTYPCGIEYRMSHEDVEAIGAAYGVTGTTDMLVDQFLWLLQMNIIKYYIVDSKKQKQKKKGKTQSKDKQSNVLGCQIKLRNSAIPNTSVSSLYQLICETKLQMELVACPIIPIVFQELSSVGKNTPSCSLVPIILNPIYRHYTSFAFYNGTWIDVCILAKLMSPNYLLLYTEEKYTRKYRLFRSTDVVLGLEAKRMVERLPCFKFTDHEVLSGKECVRKQLVKII